ncbi:NADPH-dependent F420 reductase [Xanthomonas euroxanthea]|uniref:NADPH-dependent F420 reductase n=1 Tax=Xanthomonas euroxanthea TaxID=2259622 RepID=UPI002DD621BC|nr:NAD(P)-binding domain-containing protein [Xanthomonas euroxanthea]
MPSYKRRHHMKIGIIGTGNIGGTLARKLRAAGHQIHLANSRGIDGMRELAQTIGATPVDIHGAVSGMDVVILSIPLPAVATLPKGLFDECGNAVTVIDTGNYYPDMRDPHIADIDEGMPESVWVSRQIGRPVTKAFNNILAYSLAKLGQPTGTRDRLAIAVAGDDPRAKAVASSLVDEVGFDPVDAGSLADSWRQQPATPAYCCDYNAGQMQQALAAARPGEAPAKRDGLMTALEKFGANPTHADIVAANRAMHPPR